MSPRVGGILALFACTLRLRGEAALARLSAEAAESRTAGGKQQAHRDDEDESGGERHCGGDESVLEPDAELSVDPRLQGGENAHEHGAAEGEGAGEP